MVGAEPQFEVTATVVGYIEQSIMPYPAKSDCPFIVMPTVVVSVDLAQYSQALVARSVNGLSLEEAKFLACLFSRATLKEAKHAVIFVHPESTQEVIHEVAMGEILSTRN